MVLMTQMVLSEEIACDGRGGETMRRKSEKLGAEGEKKRLAFLGYLSKA
jgi:hypothetical protein